MTLRSRSSSLLLVVRRLCCWERARLRAFVSTRGSPSAARAVTEAQAEALTLTLSAASRVPFRAGSAPPARSTGPARS